MPSSVGLFQEFMSDCLIETGSHVGDGIDKALDAGFEKVISMELVDKYYEHCINRFSRELGKEVLLFKGDSIDILKKVLITIHDKSTFWLDAHYSGGETGGKDKKFPLLGELDIIKEHQIKNHYILVDDVRLLGTSEFDDVDINTVIDKIKSINSNYKFEFRNGLKKNDIICAYIKGDKNV